MKHGLNVVVGVLIFGCLREPVVPPSLDPITESESSPSPSSTSSSTTSTSWEELMTSTSMPQNTAPTTTTAVSEDPCGNGILDHMEECDPPNPDTRCGATCLRDRIVFVTSQAYNPVELNGVLGADYVCTQHAIIAGLVLPDDDVEFPYRAWLSAPALYPAIRFFWSPGRLLRPDGLVVANSMFDLSELVEPPSMTEEGFSTDDFIWSNTDILGEPVEIGSNDCFGWKSNEDSLWGYIGFSGAVTDNWTLLQSPANPVPCSSFHPLYCFEQPGDSPVY